MASNLELMLEAERRGRLPPEKVALLNEARSRGLVGAAEAAPAEAPTQDGATLKSLITNEYGSGSKPTSGAGYAKGLMRQVLQGATFGFADEARIAEEAAKMKLKGDTRPFGQIYDEQRQVFDAEQGKFREENPIASFAGDVSGALVNPVTRAALKRIPGAPVVKYGATGALGGGLAGAGYADEGNRTEGAIKGGLVGGALGVALPAIAAAARGVVNRKAGDIAAKQASNAVRDATLKEAQAAGYVVTPSQADAGLTSRLLGGLSGKAKTEQLASLRNQKVTDALARKALNLPEGTPITPETLKAVRQQASQAGYEPVANAGAMQVDSAFTKALDDIVAKLQGPARSFPGAARDDVAKMVDGYRVQGFDSGDAIGAIRALRDSADDAFRAGNSGLGKASRAVAQAIEDQVERGLGRLGQNGAAMLKSFREARQLMAKSYTVEKALVEGSGSVDAIKLAQQLARKKPLSGELATAAKFGQSFRDVARVPQSGWNNPLTVVDYGYGAAGAGLVSPMMAALPAARVASRYSVLSPVYQRAFIKPQYGGRVVNQLARLAPEQQQNMLNMLARVQAVESGSMSSR